MNGNKYCLRLRGNHMRYADQVIGNGNYHTYAEGCFKSGKKWRIEAHTSRFFLYVDNYLWYKQPIIDDEYQEHRTSPPVFYKYANMLLERFVEENEDVVVLPVGCGSPQSVKEEVRVVPPVTIDGTFDPDQFSEDFDI